MKYFISSVLLTFSSLALAHSQCEKLYEQKLKTIAEKVDYETSVGGGAYVNPYNGSIGYNPGMSVTKEGPNWARDFLFAINYGPEKTIFSKTDGRSKEFLKGLTKALSKECKLKVDPEYTNVRALLKSLMEQDILCPQGKIIEPSIFGSYKKIHQVAVRSLRDEDQFALCDETVVKDDSHRTVKELHSPSSKKSTKSGAKKN